MEGVFQSGCLSGGVRRSAAFKKPRREVRRQACQLALRDVERPEFFRVHKVALERHAVRYDVARRSFQDYSFILVEVDAASFEIAAKRQRDARGFGREKITFICRNPLCTRAVRRVRRLRLRV